MNAAYALYMQNPSKFQYPNGLPTECFFKVLDLTLFMFKKINDPSPGLIRHSTRTTYYLSAQSNGRTKPTTAIFPNLSRASSEMTLGTSALRGSISHVAFPNFGTGIC